MADLDGKLTLTILQAKDLPDIELLGKIDPYCKVKWNKIKHKTRTIDNGGTSVEWRESFSFELKPAKYNAKECDFVNFEVKDKEMLMDRALGRIDIKLVDLLKQAYNDSNQNNELWLNLIHHENFHKRCGLLQVRAVFEGKGLEKYVRPLQQQQQANNNAAIINQMNALSMQQPLPPQYTAIQQPQPSAVYYTPIVSADQQQFPLASAPVFAVQTAQNNNAVYYQQPQMVPVSANQQRQLALRSQIVDRHQISEFFASKLHKLEQFEIVLLCDDSGSMQSHVETAANGKPRTRWNELAETVSVIVDIAGLLDENGVDLYFMNRPPVYNVNSTQQITHVFSTPPRGYTPTERTLKRIIQEKQAIINSNQKKLLVIILTDGIPTDDEGYENKNALYQLLNNRDSNRIYVSFVCCTSDDESIGYLNEWDKRIKNLDVVDDYHSERKEIEQKQGKDFVFSRGDWIVKLLLGSIDDEIDKWDEKRTKIAY